MLECYCVGVSVCPCAGLNVIDCLTVLVHPCSDELACYGVCGCGVRVYVFLCVGVCMCCCALNYLHLRYFLCMLLWVCLY